ncbi:MAG: acyltransferase [Anaerolineae bacterium]|nr:acyltransferase [Anaerolineae bacterium]
MTTEVRPQHSEMVTIAPGQATESAGTSERYRGIDLLRMLMVFGLVFFHTARVFDHFPLPEGVKNEPLSLVASIIVAFFALWGMPVMFAISGFAIWYSLKKRTAAVFIRERLQRLVVPFLFGTLVIVPLQIYLHLKQADPAFLATYWQFLPQFFSVDLCFQIPTIICADSNTGLFMTAHLWFLWDLFFFSLILLPFFLYLQTPAGKRFVGSLAGFCARSGTILLLGLPVALVDAVLVTRYNGGWSEWSFTLFLAYGCLIATDPRFLQAMGRTWRSALFIGLVVEVGYAAALFVFIDSLKIDPSRSYDWGSLLWRAGKSIGAWAWVVAIFGFGARPRHARLPHDRPGSRTGSDPPQPQTPVKRPILSARIIAYAGEAFLPLYVLHQTIIMLIAYYVVQWEMVAFLKYAVISLSSLATTLLVYEFAVRRTRVTRWLFGMRPEVKG